MHKKCPSCGADKSLSEFGRNQSLPDGYPFYCLACNRTRNKAFYRAKREAAGFTLREKREVSKDEKWCTGCEQVKMREEFHRTATQWDGLASACKVCRNKAGKAQHLKRNYGLDQEALDAMVLAQHGRCAVCQVRKPVHVDHDHGSGQVRGVLCFPCNAALGHFKDEVQWLQNAIDYLERTGTPQCPRTLVAPGVYRLHTPPSGAAASPSSSA